MNQMLVEGDHPSSLRRRLVGAAGDDAAISDGVTVNSMRLIRPRQALQGAFRDFQAEIEGSADGLDPVVIGRISGCVTWLEWLPELLEDGGMLDSFAELITAALEIRELLSTDPDSKILAVLMIDRVWLEPAWRGHRLGRRIAEELIDLMLLTPENTIVLAYLEPDAYGPRTQLVSDTSADFEQWRTSNTWWLRPSTAIRAAP